MSWQGKVVVVTGGATGIGAATSQLFAEQGAKVVFMDVNPAAAEAQVGQIKAAGGEALFVRGDVASEKDVGALADAAVSAYGRIDGLVNNAGIMRRHERLEDWPLAEIRQVLDVNLLGLFVTSYAIAPIIAKGGGGAIVNISSLGGMMPVTYSPVYGAAKAGVLGLTRSMAPELAARGVRVNAMLPSFVDTPMTADAPARQTMPMLAPGDIARGVLHIASDTASTGGFYSVNGTDSGPKLFRVADKLEMAPVESALF